MFGHLRDLACLQSLTKATAFSIALYISWICYSMLGEKRSMAAAEVCTLAGLLAAFLALRWFGERAIRRPRLRQEPKPPRRGARQPPASAVKLPGHKEERSSTSADRSFTSPTKSTVHGRSLGKSSQADTCSSTVPKKDTRVYLTVKTSRLLRREDRDSTRLVLYTRVEQAGQFHKLALLRSNSLNEPKIFQGEACVLESKEAEQTLHFTLVNEALRTDGIIGYGTCCLSDIVKEKKGFPLDISQDTQSLAGLVIAARRSSSPIDRLVDSPVGTELSVFGCFEEILDWSPSLNCQKKQHQLLEPETGDLASLGITKLSQQRIS